MEPAFDFNLITEEMGMDPEDIFHLMNIYQTEFQKDLSEFEEILSNQDWELIKNKLHKMKGDAANLCLSSLADTFLNMENTSSIKDAEQLSTQLHSVQIIKSQLLSDFHKYSAIKK